MNKVIRKAIPAGYRGRADGGIISVLVRGLRLQEAIGQV